jgi:hypothetical protein
MAQHEGKSATGYALRVLPLAVNSSSKTQEKQQRVYSYPQLDSTGSTSSPGQNSIGTGGQYLIGADKLGEIKVQSNLQINVESDPTATNELNSMTLLS